jgi:putative ABC transport system ATP-binding protein
MKTPVVTLRDVDKTYKSSGEDVHALKKINLDVFPSELLIIIGPSGSGKTTLLSVIGATLFIDGGEIIAFGNNLGRLSLEELCEFRKKYIGFVYQQFHLVPSLTAAENVATPLLIKNMEFSRSIRKATDALAQVGLGNKANRMPRELSGGEQQRVAIARAIVHEPELIISDEPTSNLDAKTGGSIIELMRGIAKSNSRSLIVVTHDHRILNYADRVAEMDDGLIIGLTDNSTPNALKENVLLR